MLEHFNYPTRLTPLNAALSLNLRLKSSPENDTENNAENNPGHCSSWRGMKNNICWDPGQD